MRLITKKEMLSFDYEVVFSHRYQNNFGPQDLCIYVQSLNNEFIYQPLIDTSECNNYEEYADLHFIAEQDSTFNLVQDYDCASRDGLFEDDSKYYVLSKKDLGNLIQRLMTTYNQMPEESI